MPANCICSSSVVVVNAVVVFIPGANGCGANNRTSSSSSFSRGAPERGRRKFKFKRKKKKKFLAIASLGRRAKHLRVCVRFII